MNSRVLQIQGRMRLPVGLVLLYTVVFCGGCAGNRDFVRTPIPSVESRFSPVSEGLNPSATGLLVQGSSDPIQSYFSQRIAAGVATEIELSQPGTRVLPWEPAGLMLMGKQQGPADPIPPVPSLPGLPVLKNDADVINIAFQPPFMVIPPPAGQFPGASELPPERIERALQIRVLEFRPWFPMKAILQLTILDCDTMEPLASTTADWVISDGKVCGGCKQGVSSGWKRHFQHHDDVDCLPSAGHNSPEAFAQIIAKQVAGWFVAQPLMHQTPSLAGD